MKHILTPEIDQTIVNIEKKVYDLISFLLLTGEEEMQGFVSSIHR
jgi:hypothetical protein